MQVPNLWRYFYRIAQLNVYLHAIKKILVQEKKNVASKRVVIICELPNGICIQKINEQMPPI